MATASPGFDKLVCQDVDSNDMYHVKNFKQRLPLKRFGHLISHALPIKLNTNGLIMRTIGKYKMLDNASIDQKVSGEILKQGMKLKQQFMGTYYNDQTRILGDYGSMLYDIKKVKAGESS